MTDNQSFASASVAPSDSVSQTPSGNKKKARPGKNQRMATRSALTPSATATTGSSSVSGQQAFSSAASSYPVPQPGKFPVVFQVGAGEPTQDSEISYDPNVINTTFNDISGRFRNAPRFAEFTEYTGYTDDMFDKDVLRFSLLALAQQTVHSHVNMGLPLGDFSSIATTDTFMFSSLRAVISQFGEFSVPSLGTRFLLADYASTVSALVFAASKCTDNSANNHARVKMSWLPFSAHDNRTKHIVATRLQEVLLPFGVSIPVSVLMECLFTKDCPQFDAVKTLLSGNVNRFDFLFKPMVSIAEWVTAFKPQAAQSVLTELRLIWPKPDASDLDWKFVPKVIFPYLIDEWARKRPAFERFFSTGSGLANRNDAHGSAAQLSTITDPGGATIVKTLVALSAPEFSLAACFPPSACTERTNDYRVVLSTPIPVRVRATEFALRDWLN